MDFVSESSIRESGLFDPQKVTLLVKKLTSGHVGEVDNMAAAGILSTQAVYQMFIKDFNGSKNGAPLNINNYYDHRKKIERDVYEF